MIMENFSGTGLAAIYSAVYNGCYMIPEIVITTATGAIVGALPVIRKNKVN
jgi:thiamine transporter ThiT